MSITLEWILERRVVRITYSEVITFDALADASKQLQNYTNQSDGYLMYCLCDVGEVTKVQLNLKAVIDATQFLANRPRFGWTVLYHMRNPKVRLIADAVLRFFKVHYRIVDTEAEALAFLNAVDPTLPPLKFVTNQQTTP
jgi:hypothetical protein